MAIAGTLDAWNCPVCRSTATPAVLATIVWKTPMPGPRSYSALRCPECTVVAANPMPSESVLNEYYSDYHPTQVHETDFRVNELVRLQDMIIDRMLPLVAERAGTPSFLDYGFGAGAFLIRLAERGYEAVGIDFGEQNIRQLERTAAARGLKMRLLEARSAETREIGPESFDCVTLFQVIEHLVDPRGVLAGLRQLLKRRGVLYLECPNQDGLFFRLKNWVRPLIDRRNMWGALSPPQHVLGFNRRSMQLLLEHAGFDVIEVGDYAVADGVHAPETANWYPSLGSWLRNSRHRTFYGTSKTLIRLCDRPASRLFKAGGGLYAVARRSD